ncbi:MAG: hypothetical protein SVU32_03530, partial [Candidatus Nanohaloarchaea archaeon]|nr:hypothetical protein [Candidatus Nanohaloarchaea archaeon]
MQLPEKTASFARATVDGWEDDLPQRIYDTAAELDYGLSGALEQGINLRYPHEVDEETNCHERAVYTYSLASALDLEPRFFEIEEDWEDPLKHAWIDVEWDGERYVIDPAQNRFGRVVSYGDQKLRVETPDGNTETKEYAFIEQRNEETIAQDIEDLREDTVAMIQDGQKLGELTEGQTRIYDKVNFDREENAFERMASFYDPFGFLNHLIRSRTYVSMDGEQKNTETLFADIDDAGWKHAWGERELAQSVDGERRLQDRSEIDDAALENMVRVVSYEQGCPDQELRYSEKEREQTWQDLQDRLEQLPDEPTGFRGRHAQNEIDRLAALREKDQQAFQREMDWRTYLRKNRMITVPDKQYEEILKQYIERHTETHYTIRQSDHQNAVETAKQQLDPS